MNEYKLKFVSHCLKIESVVGKVLEIVGLYLHLDETRGVATQFFFRGSEGKSAVFSGPLRTHQV
jgi:hypothetical protein